MDPFTCMHIPELIIFKVFFGENYNYAVSQKTKITLMLCSTHTFTLIHVHTSIR